jgi:hypothetical protein
MKSSFVKLSKLLRASLFSIATAFVLSIALLSPVHADSHFVDGHKVLIQAFTKSASRVCDKITYTFHVYILTDGNPVNVIISDVWPNGLLPASAITVTGNTSSGPTIFVNSGSWSVQFETPVGTGPTVTNYVLSFTSTIDPAALSGGDFKMINQAKIAIGRTSPEYERSDDPAVAGLEDKTVLNIPVAEVKACMPPPAPPSCLSGKVEVTCGKIPGTYNIIIHPNGVGGVIPSAITVTPLTTGITLVPAQQSYQVVGGQVMLTVAGAHAGDVLEFDVSGTTAGGGSAQGSDLCCNGKIKVEIPKDLPCKDLVPVDLAIKKTGATTPAPDVPAYVFALNVTNEGAAYTAAPGVLTVTDVVPPGMVFNSVTGTGWTCTPNTNVPAGMTVTCHNTAAMTLPAGPGAPIGTININASALGKAPFPDFTNCADIGLNPNSGAADSVPPNNKSCVTVSKKPKEKHVEFEKTCEPAVLGKGDFVAPKWEAICHIKVTTTGVIDTPIGVAEGFFGAGTVSYIGSADPWTCSPPTVTSPTPMGCLLPANTLNGPTNVSIIDVKVVLANAADGNGKMNCALGYFEKHESDPSCVPIVINNSDVIVEKTCGPVSQHKYPVNASTTGLGNFSNCQIKVTATGPITGPVSITENLSDTNSGAVLTALSGAGWTCPPTPINAPATVTCTKPAPAFSAAGTSIIDVIVQLSLTHDTAKNCANAVVNGVEGKPSCDVIIVDPPHDKGTQSISKVCDLAVEVPGPVKSTYISACHITVTTTGPQNGTLVVGENLTGNGTLGNATGSTPWVCSGTGCTVDSSQLNQTSSTSVIDVTVTFSDKGSVSEGNNCAKLSLNGAADGESCTKFTVEPPKNPNLEIVKTGLKDCKDNTPCPFTVTITSIGQPYNGNVLLYDVLTPNNLWPVTSIVPNVCGSSISTMPFGCVANLNLAADTPFSFVVTLNPVTPGALEQNENCISVATVGSNVPTGPMSFSDLQNLAHATGTGRPTQSCWPFTTGPRDIKSTQKIEKVCGPARPKDGSVDLLEAKCTITVTTTGPQTGTVSFGDSPTGVIGIVSMNSTSTPTWTCNTIGCSIPGNQLNQTASVSTFEVVANFYNANQVASAQNCAQMQDGNTPYGEKSCAKFTMGDVVNSDMYVKKVVVNHAPLPLTGMVYDITSQCSNTTQPTGFAHFSDGQTVLFHHYEIGMTCNLSEVIATPTTACGNDTPVWTTTYLTANPVTLSPNGETVTVTNTLDCKPIDPPVGNPIKVKKVVINNAPAPAGDLQFPITVTCVKGNNGEVLDTDAAHNVADGQTVDYLPYAAGFSCSAHEGTIPQTNACGKDTPIWTTTYATQPVAMTPAGETITVTNMLNCKHIDVPVQTKPSGLNCDERTTKLSNGQCRCTIQGMTPTSKLACGCAKGTEFRNGACWKMTPELTCKDGTHKEGARCVQNAVRCAPPSVRNPVTNTCFVPPPICRNGTHAVGRTCVPNEAVCRPPSKRDPRTNTCVVPEQKCGPGTHKKGRNCVADAPKDQKCGRGQINVKGHCIPVPHCPFGTIPIPGTPICVNPFGGIGGGGGGKPRGDTGGGAVP